MQIMQWANQYLKQKHATRAKRRKTWMVRNFSLNKWKATYFLFGLIMLNEIKYLTFYLERRFLEGN